MFEKIFQKLKEARPANSAVSDRTLETQAKTLANIITTDELLTNFDAKPIVDSLDGNIRHTASEAVKKSQAEKEAKEKAEKEAKDKAEKDAKAAEEAAKKANGGKEPPEYVKQLMEQNKLLSDSLQAITQKVEGIQKNSITTSRESQLTKVLEGVPDYLANPIKNSFKVAAFDNDDSFTEYLTGVQESTKTFQESAKKQGLNTFSPSMEVKKPENTGQTPEIQKARELVNKIKEKENATNSNK